MQRIWMSMIGQEIRDFMRQVILGIDACRNTYDHIFKCQVTKIVHNMPVALHQGEGGEAGSKIAHPIQIKWPAAWRVLRQMEEGRWRRKASVYDQRLGDKLFNLII